MEEKLRPRAAAAAVIAGLDADLVLVEEGRLWSGPDFLRNDPLLRNRPLVLSLDALGPERAAALMATHRAVVVGPEALRAAGIARGDRLEPMRRPPVSPGPSR
jgi:hypothetical protein